MTTAELLIVILDPQQRHDLVSALLTALDLDVYIGPEGEELLARWTALIKLLQQEVD